MIIFKDLPSTFHVRLEKDYRYLMFEELKSICKSYSSLADYLGISKSQVYHLKNGRYCIKLPLLFKLAKLLDRPEEIEKHITEFMSNRGSKLNLKLPIRPSSKLASIIGHCFGDGAISQTKKEFYYANFYQPLLEDVKFTVLGMFNAVPIHESNYRLVFSTLLGELLVMAGAPSGYKVHSCNDVPEWIKNGTQQIKRSFLQAIFDDDGSPMFSKRYAAKNVNLHLTRVISKKKYLERLLNSIKNMLLDLGVSFLGPYISRTYEVEREKRIVMYIMTSDRENIKKFHRVIGFRSKEKLHKLELIVRRCKGVKI